MSAKGRIYTVGGFGPLGIRLRGFMFAEWRPLDSVYVFDLEAGSWGLGPAKPESRGAGGAVVTANSIGYAGGIAPT